MPATDKGGDRLVSTLHEAGAALGDMSDSNEHIAGWLGPRVVKATPRRTGTLASTVAASGWGQGLTVEAGTDYAAAVHKRNPWIARTIEQAGAELVTAVTEDVENVLSTVKGS
jgi:hypothetical protein